MTRDAAAQPPPPPLLDQLRQADRQRGYPEPTVTAFAVLDRKRYYLDNVGGILGALQAIVREADVEA
jgi:hypothetical protein